ncbi:AcrR family transcriptional regulator [Clostridium acetobutylicum]|uniref:Transcriptional regulator, AcrR family n=1 Tax=Clostridium acetobutylicum (strain ATCC 824 / DSM 792 / JCM 1419 / IAM 19013 / LMG 5710 / NBRC 13948 / NRRL B-527 / VKM B-1787 / 2291 / W) TaxID=272562 RepID=Q97LU7_CLOAB|nr:MULTISPECIES: TetR/AcrR family transcriptional regulator [Clostridium]AAK78437.1 Transcriptional regulator, AcrR family [Clostridium acetobutylicum ATCC 824]ADZ19507.1 Transcriptional regulator, AcrR family [Clostridium acetobutylicum EA 2018]AEI31253.1 AcrR family transcriptional regulator [Clostridium acetobutylicum DSM 1731]AWV80159.1 TetR/AcrR family transcriptional regulator [Clostridium acetobutylicum]MBC2392340.1 TetR/AcrR family transcriptional regulator [Clostridium acetobutylicum]
MRKKDDKKQENIKNAVVKLILKEGFHGTSISKIAKEADVSPATVYIYYENKDEMLRKIYLEYSKNILNHLLNNISESMSGKELIESLVKNYYLYIRDNKEIFLFVEQFSSCPSLANTCEKITELNYINSLLDSMKKNNIIRNYHNDTIISTIFSPVKSIAINHCLDISEKIILLREIIKILQDALII